MNATLEKNKIQESDIFEVCKEIGISCNLIGYRYIKSAIMKIADNEDIFYSRKLTSLYKDISADFCLDGHKTVERGIRTAIEKIFMNGATENLRKVFGSAYSPESGRPTVGEFLANLYEYLKIHKMN